MRILHDQLYPGTEPPSVPKTPLERRRRAVDSIAPFSGFQRGSKSQYWRPWARSARHGYGTGIWERILSPDFRVISNRLESHVWHGFVFERHCLGHVGSSDALTEILEALASRHKKMN